MASNKKIISDISVSGLQMLVTQFSGAIVFYLLSDILPKEDIGIINWSLAVLMILFAMAGFGIDQLTVRKIAMGADPVASLKTYFFHLLFTGAISLVVITILFLYPGTGRNVQLFSMMAVSSLLLYLSMPFKQVANGFEKFGTLFGMSTIANITRVIGIIVLLIGKNVSALTVALLYIFSSALELFVCYILYRFYLQLPLRIGFHIRTYRSAIKASLPQLGVIFFNALIARMDWVLLGLMCSAIVVAEYSFAYKFFELASFPLLVIGQLLLPKIAKAYSRGGQAFQQDDKKWIFRLAGIEMQVAVFTALMIQLCWTPVIDLITHGKYGASNHSVIAILSICFPFLYLNNLLWSVAFAEGKLKQILRIFFITAVTNAVADIVFIRLFAGKGAAIGFVLSMFVQMLLYTRYSSLRIGRVIAWDITSTSIIGLIAWLSASIFSQSFTSSITCATLVYLVLIILSRRTDWKRYFIKDEPVSL